VKKTLYTFWILKVTLRERANSNSGHFELRKEREREKEKVIVISRDLINSNSV
jgi:hypothetical protein